MFSRQELNPRERCWWRQEPQACCSTVTHHFFSYPSAMAGGGCSSTPLAGTTRQTPPPHMTNPMACHLLPGSNLSLKNFYLCSNPEFIIDKQAPLSTIIKFIKQRLN